MAKEYLIGDILKRIKRPIELDDNTDYKLVTVKMNHNGVLLRELKKGFEIKSNMFLVKIGDFILSGIDARNGAFGIISDELNDAIVTNDFWYFEIDENIISKELFLELTATTWFDDICKKGSDGTTQRIRLQKDKFFNQTVWLPEKNEQESILAKIKNAKSKLNRFAEENQTQSQLLTQLRQSILQEAIQGKLTENWRAENPNTEPAEKLLQRIKTEKEKLIKKKKIKVGKKQASNDIGDIKFELPKDWIFVELDDITQFITDGTHQTPKYTEKGRVFLSAQNVKPFKFMPENHKYVSEEAYQEFIAGKEPEKGDLLVGRVGSKGETAVIDREIDFAYYVSLGLVKTFKEFTSPEYLAIVMNSPFGNRYAVGNMSSIGTAAGNFNLGRIRSFPIPLPPLSEQHAIVSQVEKLLGKCTSLQSEIENLNTHSKTLLKALFAETFANND